MDIFQIQRNIADVNPEVIFEISGFPITNSFLMTILILVVLALFAVWIKQRFSVMPNFFQSGIEIAYEAMVNLVDDITGDVRKSSFIFPLIGSLFVYIFVANVIGFVPGVTSFTFDGTPLFRIATTDFNTTFGLALALMILFQFMAMKEWGFFAYVSKYIQIGKVIRGFKQGVGEGFLAVIEFFVGLLDIISEFAKVISLSMRLFGNIYAGEVLAVIVLGAFAYGLPSVWMALSMLFAVVQAVVFGALAVAYYDMAVAEPNT